jgi:hypothetical protein
MNEVLQYPAEFMQETVHMPSVCLALPFEPQLHDKNTITSCLKAMLAKAESRLLQLYPTNKALPVLTRIQQLIASINFSNYKKSIALLASPYSSQLFYLDFPVTETVRTGENLDVREVVKAKCKEVQYLVLVLDNHSVKMYKGTSSSLTCVKINQETGDPASGYDANFLYKMDQGLDLMLKAYGLPVFVLGRPQALGQLRQLTTHEDDILAWVSGQFDTSNEAAILMALQPALNQWNKHKHRLLLKKLHKAREERKLSCGITEVWNTVTHRRAQLLVVEQNFMSPGYRETNKEMPTTFTGMAVERMQLKDQVDDIIEKVLKDGGNVEFAEQGTLSDFQHIALIEFHQSL